MADVYHLGPTVRLGGWARNPCHRCHRQPVEGEHIQVDFMAQTILCQRCHTEDTIKLGNLLAQAMGADDA
jgi:hypothetical protein